MPQSIEGWQELKHIFKKWKNLNNNKEDLITNPQYIAWFRRNCDNGNIPEISKKEKINDFLHIDIDDNDENSPTKINNYINRIKKQRDSHEPMPYDEWFSRNCENPSVSYYDITLPSDRKYISEQKDQKTDMPLISLEDIIGKPKLDSDTKTNENEDKNKNTPYNEKEIKAMYNYINGLKNNKEKKNALSSLRKSVDNNDIKKNQINKLNDLFDKKLKKEGINKVIEKNKNPKKKEILNNIVDLWDANNEKEEKEFFDNIDRDTLEIMPEEEQKKKINDIFNEEEKTDEKKDIDKSVNKLANIMNKFDKDKKDEMIEYLKENNKDPKQEEKLNK